MGNKETLAIEIRIQIQRMLKDLNDLYKYDKQTWINTKKAAIRLEIEKHNENDQEMNGGLNLLNLSDEEIEQKSHHDYAAYVYLVLKVSLEHPVLYKLINVRVFSII
jgi:hypothetical protein